MKRVKVWSCGRQIQTMVLFWGELAGRSCWREHVKRVKVWSFARYHAKRQIQTVVTFGEDLWSDRKSGHYGENMRSDPTGGPDWVELVERSKVWPLWRERVK